MQMFNREDKKRQHLLLIMVALMLTAACWSSDTMFITLTATPLATPTHEASTFNSLYQVGDSVVIVGQGIAAVYLTQNPEPGTRRNRVPNAACYPNSSVIINDVAQVDGVTYYQIECNNTIGWLSESSLSLPEGN